MNRYIKYIERIKFKPPGVILRFISKLLPKPDPDFDDLYEGVDFWYLEIDQKLQLPTREIGFNKDGIPIVIGPFRSNRGLWIDSPVKWNPDDFESISKDDFEAKWDSLKEKFK
jgi:hypothetical protein